MNVSRTSESCLVRFNFLLRICMPRKFDHVLKTIKETMTHRVLKFWLCFEMKFTACNNMFNGPTTRSMYREQVIVWKYSHFLLRICMPRNLTVFWKQSKRLWPTMFWNFGFVLKLTSHLAKICSVDPPPEHSKCIENKWEFGNIQLLAKNMHA